jgi:hypothetical protein
MMTEISRCNLTYIIFKIYFFIQINNSDMIIFQI